MANWPSRHRQHLRGAQLWGRTVPLGDLTRSPHDLSWASMGEEHAAARTDTPEEFPSGPTLAPVRRRGELHLLALMLAAAVVFVATAIAKPWGEGVPSPKASAATTSLVAEVTTPSTESVPQPGASATTESLVIEIVTLSTESPPPPGASAATESLPTETDQRAFIVVAAGDSPVTYTVVCTQDPGMSPSVVGSRDVLSSQIVALACTSANLQRSESVLPSPSAP